MIKVRKTCPLKRFKKTNEKRQWAKINTNVFGSGEVSREISLNGLIFYLCFVPQFLLLLDYTFGYIQKSNSITKFRVSCAPDVTDRVLCVLLQNSNYTLL